MVQGFLLQLHGNVTVQLVNKLHKGVRAILAFDDGAIWKSAAHEIYAALHTRSVCVCVLHLSIERPPFPLGQHSGFVADLVIHKCCPFFPQTAKVVDKAGQGFRTL